MTNRHTCIHCGKRRLEKYMKRVEQHGSFGNYKWKCVLCGSNFTYQIKTFFDYVVSEAGEGIIIIPIIPMRNLFGSLMIFEKDKDGSVINEFILREGEDYCVLFHHVFLEKRLCPT